MKSYNISRIAISIMCLSAVLPSSCNAFMAVVSTPSLSSSSSYYSGRTEWKRMPKRRQTRTQQPQSNDSKSIHPACNMLTAEQSLTILIGSTIDIDPRPLSGGGGTILLLSIVALTLVTAAQTLINSMLDGDRGLRAFLSDGSGYNNSAFKGGGRRGRTTDGNTSSNSSASDPLSWLTLPKLDFVDVVGQEKETVAVVVVPNKEEEALVVQKLEKLAERLRFELQDGEKGKAEKTALELESLMQKYGFNYKENSSSMLK